MYMEILWMLSNVYQNLKLEALYPERVSHKFLLGVSPGDPEMRLLTGKSHFLRKAPYCKLD